MLVNYYKKLSRGEDKWSSNEDGELVPGGLSSGPSLLCTISVTGRLERGRSLNMPESPSGLSSDLLTSKSAHTLEEMLLSCSLFLDRRKQK